MASDKHVAADIGCHSFAMNGRRGGAKPTMRRVLMIAFQFPPFAGSSAVERTLRFVQYLPQFGWQPIVLTAKALAFEQTREDQLVDVPSDTIVARALGLDTARHLGLFRRYPKYLALPDRWISWWPAAVLTGMQLIRRHEPDVLWSTFPIPTAHVIARSLHRHSGLPWIADFRDPMVQPNDPDDPRVWRAYQTVERRTLESSQLNVFTTSGTRDLYASRYPTISRSAFGVVENGYDEDAFPPFCEIREAQTSPSSTLLMLHSGAIYPLERNPTQLFLALRDLVADGSLSAANFRLRLRATGHDSDIGRLIDATGVGHIVELAPPLPYKAAIAEMTHADVLLVLQASQVRTQVPAKVYEYLRARRPILGLTDLDGDTASVLRSAGVHHLANINSRDNIGKSLRHLLAALRSGHVHQPDEDYVKQLSRWHRTRQLASLLDRVADARSAV
jgi:hypothetical protein